MASGRTPTLTIVGSAGTLTLVDEHSAYPFPSLDSQRRSVEIYTRPSNSSPGIIQAFIRPYTGGEDTLAFDIPHLLEGQKTLLWSLYRADPPSVTVTYLGETWPGYIASCSINPDNFEVTEFQASLTIRRTGIT